VTRPQPSIDVVVPTYNGWELTEACLRHLERQTVEHTVIVSDNASEDGTPDRVRRAFPHVRVVETGGNLGFAVACNAGARAGSSEVIVLLNNDADAAPEFLERLVRPLAGDPSVATATPVMLRPGGELIDSVGLAADATMAGFPRLQGRPAREAVATTPELLGPSGGAGAYRRTAWERAAGLDERIFIYSEDLDLALRLRAAGWGAALAPAATCIHHGSQTMGKRSAWQRSNGGWARGYLLRRYGVLRGRFAPRALATEAIVSAGDLVLSRDLVALSSRVRGWREARGLPRHAVPAEGVAYQIGFAESLRRRRGDYRAGAAA
jgi:N-acetylglucosaminyl-diphospho-decaprenol L-rhamnosyltransferase